MHNCVDNLLLVPLSQQILAQHRNEKWVDELLDGSLKLLDVCSTAKDPLLRTRELSHGLQSSLRRRQGGENGISAEVGQYLTSREECKEGNAEGPEESEGDGEQMQLLSLEQRC